jgi:hypothetical protein
LSNQLIHTIIFGLFGFTGHGGQVWPRPFRECANTTKMANLRNEVQEELEVLRAIYDVDFESRPSAWANAPSFAIKIAPTKDSQHQPNELTVVGKNRNLIEDIFILYI